MQYKLNVEIWTCASGGGVAGCGVTRHLSYSPDKLTAAK